MAQTSRIRIFLGILVTATIAAIIITIYEPQNSYRTIAIASGFRFHSRSFIKCTKRRWNVQYRVLFYGHSENLPCRVCQSLEMHLRQVVFGPLTNIYPEVVSQHWNSVHSKCSFWASLIDMVNTHYLRLTGLWVSFRNWYWILDIWYFRLSHESRVNNIAHSLQFYNVWLYYFWFTLFSC